MNKNYPKLYARTSTGATQIWWMEQEGSKYRSTSGQIDGAKVVAEWTEAEPTNVGKTNERNAIQQASFEIDAKYKKQLKSGGYWENEADIDKTRFFEVMLAKDFDDYKDKIDWSKGVGVQIKYNGGRVIASRHGLFSRKGEKYISIPHIEEALAPFFKKFPDAILDGEGFNYPLREKLNEIMKLLRKTVHVEPADLAKSKDLIRYYIYDGYGFAGITQNDCYTKRKAAIDNAFFAKCFAPRYVNVVDKVPTWYVKSEAELQKLYQSFLQDKQEGAILRITGEAYQNKRSKFLLKYKPIDDDEFKVISVQDGKGKFANRVSTVTCQRVDGKLFKDGTNFFDATFKGTAEEAVACWKIKDSLMNKVVTIYYNGFSGYLKPNYPRFDWNNYDKGH